MQLNVKQYKTYKKLFSKFVLGSNAGAGVPKVLKYTTVKYINGEILAKISNYLG